MAPPRLLGRERAARVLAVPLPAPFLVEDTLRGGQAFRWRVARELSASLVGTVGGFPARVSRDAAGSGLRASIVVEVAYADLGDAARARAAVRRYFRILDPYDRQLARLEEDPLLRSAIGRYRGLRLLNQDPWEALASFIVSANNNVLRIEGILDRVAQEAGSSLRSPWGTLHDFPGPRRTRRITEERLRSLGLGYRAPFLREAARLAGWRLNLAALQTWPYERARDALLDIPGVGPKVADCVLAFGLNHTEAFAVDRHVARAVRKREPSAPERLDDLRAWARARWGRDAALAQQFLFHEERMRSRLRPRVLA